MMRNSGASKGVLALALWAAFGAIAIAQVPAGYVLAGQGRVMALRGDNLIVDVKQGTELGFRQFKITSQSDIVFYKDGKPVQVFDLKVGDQVAAYRPAASTTTSVTVSEEEIKAIQAEAAPAPAPPPEPAPAATEAAAPEPAPVEEKPAVLPKSGSSLPLLLALGAGLVAAGAGLSLSRRI